MTITTVLRTVSSSANTGRPHLRRRDGHPAARGIGAAAFGHSALADGNSGSSGPDNTVWG